jgi:hypothetical protein
VAAALEAVEGVAPDIEGEGHRHLRPAKGTLVTFDGRPSWDAGEVSAKLLTRTEHLAETSEYLRLGEQALDEAFGGPAGTADAAALSRAAVFLAAAEFHTASGLALLKAQPGTPPPSGFSASNAAR